MRKINKAILTAVSALTLTLGASTAAHADGHVRWQNVDPNIQICLGHITDNWGPPNDVAMRGCNSGEAQWYDQNLGGNDWLQRADDNRNYCLTAYSDADVYMEQCSGNDWQRWNEEYVNGHWHLHHKATGWCLQADDRGKGIVVRACDYKAQNQMWD